MKKYLAPLIGLILLGALGTGRATFQACGWTPPTPTPTPTPTPSNCWTGGATPLAAAFGIDPNDASAFALCTNDFQHYYSTDPLVGVKSDYYNFYVGASAILVSGYQNLLVWRQATHAWTNPLSLPAITESGGFYTSATAFNGTTYVVGAGGTSGGSSIGGAVHYSTDLSAWTTAEMPYGHSPGAAGIIHQVKWLSGGSRFVATGIESAPQVWSRSTPYARGEVAETNELQGSFVEEADTNSDSAVYEAQNAGTSGSAKPAFCAGSGCTVVDNTITWKNTGQGVLQGWLTGLGYSSGSYVSVPVVNNKPHIFKAQNNGTSGGTQPTWCLAVGCTVTDNTITWINVGSLAIRPGIWNSADGQTWAEVDVPAAVALLSSHGSFEWFAAWYNGTTEYIVSALDEVLSTTDGQTFTLAGTMSGGGLAGGAYGALISWDNTLGLWEATSQGTPSAWENELLWSTDFVHWTVGYTAPSGFSCTNMIRVGSKLYNSCADYSGTPIVLSSSDGKNWTSANINLAAGSAAIWWAGAPDAVSIAGNIYHNDSGNENLELSADAGVNWTRQSPVNMENTDFWLPSWSPRND